MRTVTGPSIERDARILAHMCLVMPIAHDIWRKLPRGLFELEDLVQIGMIGLIRAADAFEEGRAPFKHFAKLKIKGIIQDRTRRRDLRETQNLPLLVERAAPHTPHLSAAETSIEVAGAMARLPESERKVINIIYLQERTAASAAMEMGLYRGKVLTMRKSGLRKMRKIHRKAA